MGKINGGLKCLFIFFNVMSAIFGCLMIYGTMKASAYGNQMSAMGGPSLAWSWVFSIGILGISCLGIYAGYTEKAVALKVFAGFMVAGMIIMLIFGIIIVVAKAKVKVMFEDSDSELLKALMENQQMRDSLNVIQENIHCCGVASAKDWGAVIPDSCACRGSGYSSFGVYGASGCTSRPAGTSGPSQIYKQPCNEFILTTVDVIFRVAMGICFGFAVIALLGLLVSVLMIHQVTRHNDIGGPPIIMKGY